MYLFSERLLPNPIGLVNNTGIHCYWNSVLQILNSCTSLRDRLVENSQPATTTNSNSAPEFTPALHDFVTNKITNIDLYKNFIYQLSCNGRSNEALAELISNQQSAQLIVADILELLEKSKPIYELFEHRYNQIIKCNSCNFSSTKKINDYIFQMSPNSTNLIEDLSISVEKIDDYACSKCGDKGPKYKVNQLAFLSEILIINVKNYSFNDVGGVKLNTELQFPEYIAISNLRFRAVAYIDHYGRLESGHYVASCLRKCPETGEICWYLFDDSRYIKGNYSPNTNTCILLYHMI